MQQRLKRVQLRSNSLTSTSGENYEKTKCRANKKE